MPADQLAKVLFQANIRYSARYLANGAAGKNVQTVPPKLLLFPVQHRLPSQIQRFGNDMSGSEDGPLHQLEKLFSLCIAESVSLADFLEHLIPPCCVGASLLSKYRSAR